jgi:hypothetical protein
MNKQPITKKNYRLEPTALDRIYKLFLEPNNCNSLHIVRAPYSRVDAIMNSGGTSVVIEYKERNQPMTYYWNESAILERSKYDAIVNIAVGLNAHAFYLMEFNDAVLIYVLNQDNKAYQWEMKNCPVENGNNRNVYTDKEVTYLPFNSADFIVSKKDWKRKTKEDLAYYLKEMKRRIEENVWTC